jgi:hypothetical protein
VDPMAGDLECITRFQEPWVVRKIGPGLESRQRGEVPGAHDPFEYPRAVPGAMGR